jgi:hypothetical protein
VRKIIISVLVVFAATLATAVPARATTTATNETLSAVSCVTTKYCVAVGLGPVNAKEPYGAISVFWNGVKWRRVAMKPPSATSPYHLYSVSCTSTAYCVTIGSYGLAPGASPFAETWNGRTWTLTVLPKPAGVVRTQVAGASCGATRHCVAVGYYLNAKNLAEPLVATLTGSKWAIRHLSLPAGGVVATFSAVSCPSTTFCALVGQFGTATAHHQNLFESWNGRAFTRMKVASVPAGPPSISVVSCVSAKACVAVGQSAAAPPDNGVAEVWSGKAWSVGPVTWPKATLSSILDSVSCVAVGKCAAVGGETLSSNPDGFQAVAVADNGKAWALTNFPAPPKGDFSELLGVSCKSTAFCVAVGETGPNAGPQLAALTGIWNGKKWRLVPAH